MIEGHLNGPVYYIARLRNTVVFRAPSSTVYNYLARFNGEKVPTLVNCHQWMHFEFAKYKSTNAL